MVEHKLEAAAGLEQTKRNRTVEAPDRWMWAVAQAQGAAAPAAPCSGAAGPAARE